MFSKDRWQLWRRIVFGFLLFIAPMFMIGCGPEVQESFTRVTRVSTAVTAELPDGVRMARDAMITYVTFKYDIRLPVSDADWAVEYDPLEDFIGSGAYRLTADSCVVTISNPLMSPDTTIYHVVLDDAAAGIHWEGDVDCLGQVLQPWSSADDPAVPVPDSINIVELAGLHSTAGIEVYKLDCASYTPLFTIGNQELISSLISALDSDMPLRPHVPCPAVYQLRFILADGQHHDFGYTCQMMTPTYLRGNQEFWVGQDGIAPDAFNDLMLPLIAPGLPGDSEWKPDSGLLGL